MKKKLTMILLALALCTTSLFTVDMKANAQETEEGFAYESLSTEDALIGNMQSQTWGVYLSSGTSIINDAGGGKIGAGGSTTAAVKCKVQVVPLVEKLSNGTWNYVTSWTVTTASGYSAMASKSITVGTGYYYRVRCTHSAATDVSSSCTSALWMGN